MGRTGFQQALAAREAVKVIAGINNFDMEVVLRVVRAAAVAGAQAVDVAAWVELVKAAKEALAGSETVLFASSIEPQELAEAVAAGADVAELGNFDALYDQGLFLSADDVLKLAQETVALVQGRALVSITVPGHLSADSQVQLARELEALGVDLIQTEGAARVLATEPTVKSLDAAEKEALTLRNTRLLVDAVRVPVMTASGITAENVSKALASGAAAVGVGSYIRAAQDEAAMAERVEAVMVAIASRPVLVSRAS